MSDPVVEAMRLQALALQKLAATRQGPQAFATTQDGGQVFRMDDGSLSFKNQGYATNDQDTIRRLMEGSTPLAEGQRSIDEQRIAANPVASRALKAVEGVPFVGSYADEAVGMVNPQAAENMRAASGAMDRQRPGQSLALGLGGSVAGALPLAVAAGPSLAAQAAGTVGGRAVQALGLGAAVGGAEGAIYGAGEQDGGRLNNAMMGGAIGAGLGGALGAAAPYTAEGLKRAISGLRGSDVRVIQSQLSVTPATARVIKNALDAGDVNEAMAALNRAGPGAMLADAGQPARELLDAAANAGGRGGTIARQAVDERAALASEQMTAALDRHLGQPQGIREAQRAVRDSTSSARAAAYNAAYSQPIDYSAGRGQALEGYLRRVPQSAINRANELMRLEGVESAQIMARVADDGSVTYTRMPDVRQLDYITRALGDVAAEADGKGALGGTTQLGRGYGNLATSIRQTLRREVPEYGTALDTAADAIKRTQAIDLGASLLRSGTTREEVAQGMRGMSRAERDAFKQGIRQNIDDTLANVTRTMTDPNTDIREGSRLLREMSSRASREKIQMALGGRAARELTEELEQAAVAYELRAAIAANSKTAIRQSIQGGVEQQTAPGMIEVLGQGKPLEASQRFVQLFTGSSPEAQRLRQMGIYEEIATVLTQTRGADAQRALNVVQRAMNGQVVTDRQAAMVGRTIAATGVLAGNRAGSTQLATP